MDSSGLKKSNEEIGQQSRQVAENIYKNLNQGNLFEIHQILNNLRDDHEKSCVINVFIEKFNFNFLRYI